MTDNMKVWDAVKQPPASALRIIQAGRLKGKTDINPQWRYQVMTEQFGQCGIGWSYEVVRVWNEPLPDGQILAFAEVLLHVGDNASIPGIGGSMLVTKEQAGLHASDEGYKMAITDALSVAMKMLGVGANIYAGLSDSKYQPTQEATKPAPPATQPDPKLWAEKSVETKPDTINPAQNKKLHAMVKEQGIAPEQVKSYMKDVFKKMSSKELTVSEASRLIDAISTGKLNNHMVEAAKKLGAVEE